MPTTTLKKAAKELGVSMNATVSYSKRGEKAVIEIDLKLPHAQNGKKRKNDVFDTILAMSEDVGIKDWAVNHDHYLYGAAKRRARRRHA